MKDFTLEELKNAKPIFDKSVNRWLAPSYYHANGEVGGYLYHSEEAAKEELEFIIKKTERKIRFDNEERQRVENERVAEEKLIASFNGFLSSDKMKAGKQMKTLMELIRWDGKITTKKEFIEGKIALGYRPKIDRKALFDTRRRFIGYSDDKTEYLMWNEQTGFSSTINKTQFEYAEFLLKNK